MTSLPTFHTKPLKARAAAILFYEGRLLLMQQNNKPFWVLPGGTLEENESLSVCAARELEEEAGLTVSIGPLLALSEFSDARRHVLDATFQAHYLAGPLAWNAPYPENINAIAWVDEATFTGGLILKPQCLHHYISEHWHTLSRHVAPATAQAAVYLGMETA